MSRAIIQNQQSWINGLEIEDAGGGDHAIFSVDGEYRYQLQRTMDFWNRARKGTVGFVMLNPSTATAYDNDKTVRRCVGFAQSWGFGRLIVANCFALRSKDWKVLKTHSDPIGPVNDEAIFDVAIRSSAVICAWGTQGVINDRSQDVLEIITAAGHHPLCLRITDSGQPYHPLYCAGDLKPIVLPMRNRGLSKTSVAAQPVEGQAKRHRSRPKPSAREEQSTDPGRARTKGARRRSNPRRGNSSHG